MAILIMSCRFQPNLMSTRAADNDLFIFVNSRFLNYIYTAIARLSCVGHIGVLLQGIVSVYQSSVLNDYRRVDPLYPGLVLGPHHGIHLAIKRSG